MPTYQPRIADNLLSGLLSRQPLVVIEGAKGVGKTATARRLTAAGGTDMNLESDAVLQAVQADPPSLAGRPRPLFVDEWQLWPSIWNELRRLVDEGAPAGSFLLAGSMIPLGARVHSGAGRAVTFRMRPMSLAERGLDQPSVSLAACLEGEAPIRGAATARFPDYMREVLASGFPGIRALPTAQARAERLQGYLEAVIEKDFTAYGHRVKRPATLRRWLASFAAATSTYATYSRILDGATPGQADKPSKTTTISYRDALSAMWLLDEVPPWAEGEAFYQRLTRAPKHFLADPALAASLLELDQADLCEPTGETRPDQLFGPVSGRLFEALIAQSLQIYAQAAGATVSYFRTQDGRREVDFIIERKRRAVAVEVKLAQAVQPGDTGNLLWLKQALGPRLADALLINTGPEAYRRRDGIAVVPASLLGP
ncbi:MAG: DUF4143 domain-containing protein [Bifidobacteriaceae bacterium]|jgi:predicted AAA+ superfamily ATPase|nr:DUF4143 domain-containing protein [Bifidobacteriaceae bacterium]